MNIFNDVLNPIVDVLSQILKFFYGFTHDYTLSIVLLTIVVKLVLHPLTRTQLRSMKAMQVLAPHMEALKRKHKDNPKTLNQEMMALYRAHNVNPMMGCLPMLVQMPVLWGLFRLLYLNPKDLFGGATVTGIPWLRLDDIPSLNKVFAEIPSHPERALVLLIPVLVGGSTWWQQKMSVTDPRQARMFVFMPIMIGYFATLYPVGLSIYWIVSTVAYIGEFFLVVGRPHPMAAAPPKSQTASPGAAGGRGPAAPGRPTEQEGSEAGVKSAEGSGRTVEEAIREALRVLGARREDVDLVVLDEGSRGVLGLGARPAQVRLTLLSEMEEDASAPQGAVEAEATAQIGEGGDPMSAARSVTMAIIGAMGFRGAVNARLDEGVVRVSVTGQQLAPLIGRHGQTLEALELLVSLIVAHRVGRRVLVSVDVERYRERRRQALLALAQRTAARVQRTGKAVALEPMSSSERRVIHTALAQDAGVSTHSEGEDAERHVVIGPRTSPATAGVRSSPEDEAQGENDTPGAPEEAQD